MSNTPQGTKRLIADLPIALAIELKRRAVMSNVTIKSMLVDMLEREFKSNVKQVKNV